jgi:anti-anti-sigma factor
VNCRIDPGATVLQRGEALPVTGLSLLSRADQRVCVALTDERMTQGLNDLRWHLPTLLAGGTNTLVIDVSGVARLSSTCVATLLWVKRSCQSRSVRVVLADPTDRTLDVLTRTGLASVFEIEGRVS